MPATMYTIQRMDSSLPSICTTQEPSQRCLAITQRNSILWRRAHNTQTGKMKRYTTENHTTLKTWPFGGWKSVYSDQMLLYFTDPQTQKLLSMHSNRVILAELLCSLIAARCHIGLLYLLFWKLTKPYCSIILRMLLMRINSVCIKPCIAKPSVCHSSSVSIFCPGIWVCGKQVYWE